MSNPYIFPSPNGEAALPPNGQQDMKHLGYTPGPAYAASSVSAQPPPMTHVRERLAPIENVVVPPPTVAYSEVGGPGLSTTSMPYSNPQPIPPFQTTARVNHWEGKAGEVAPTIGQTAILDAPPMHASILDASGLNQWSSTTVLQAPLPATGGYMITPAADVPPPASYNGPLPSVSNGSGLIISNTQEGVSADMAVISQKRQRAEEDKDEDLPYQCPNCNKRFRSKTHMKNKTCLKNPSSTPTLEPSNQVGADNQGLNGKLAVVASYNEQKQATAHGTTNAVYEQNRGLSPPRIFWSRFKDGVIRVGGTQLNQLLQKLVGWKTHAYESGAVYERLGSVYLIPTTSAVQAKPKNGMRHYLVFHDLTTGLNVTFPPLWNTTQPPPEWYMNFAARCAALDNARAAQMVAQQQWQQQVAQHASAFVPGHQSPDNSAAGLPVNVHHSQAPLAPNPNPYMCATGWQEQNVMQPFAPIISETVASPIETWPFQGEPAYAPPSQYALPTSETPDGWENSQIHAPAPEHDQPPPSTLNGWNQQQYEVVASDHIYNAMQPPPAIHSPPAPATASDMPQMNEMSQSMYEYENQTAGTNDYRGQFPGANTEPQGLLPPSSHNAESTVSPVSSRLIRQLPSRANQFPTAAQSLASAPSACTTPNATSEALPVSSSAPTDVPAPVKDKEDAVFPPADEFLELGNSPTLSVQEPSIYDLYHVGIGDYSEPSAAEDTERAYDDAMLTTGRDSYYSTFY